MSTNNTGKELREFERRRGENSDDSGKNENDNLDDENWEKYSDYESNEDTKVSNNVNKNGSSTGGNIQQSKSIRHRSIKTSYPHGGNNRYLNRFKFNRDEIVEGGDKYGTFDKYEKFDKRENFGTYDKRDKYGKYDKSDKSNNFDNFEKHENFEKFEKYDKYDKYDKYSKYDKYEKYDNYNKYEKHDSYDTYDTFQKDGVYKDHGYKKQEYKKDYNKDYTKDYNKDYIKPAFQERKYSNKDSSYSGSSYKETYNSNYPTPVHGEDQGKSFVLKEKRDYKNTITQKNDYSSRDFGSRNPKPEETSVHQIDKIINTNTSYTKKTNTDNFEEKSFDHGKSTFNYDRVKSSSYHHKDSYATDKRDFYKKDDRKRFNKEPWDFKNPDKIQRDAPFEELKKPVFINSKLQKVSENIELEVKKGMPISSILNVPLNKIDEKISIKKELYIQEQMGNISINANAKKMEINNNESISFNNNNNNNKNMNTDSNKVNSPSSNINPPQMNQYYGMQRPPYFGYPINPGNQVNPGYIQQNPNLNFPYNRQMMNMPMGNPNPSPSPHPNPNPNPYPNPHPNLIASPNQIPNPNMVYNNSHQLTNYYGVPMQNMPNCPNFQNMFQNYYQNNSHLNPTTVSGINPEEENQELDVKEFSDKLNLNAKVYVPKNKPIKENKFDMSYPKEDTEQNYSLQQNLQRGYSTNPYNYYTNK